jgi:hypothetical protein
MGGIIDEANTAVRLCADYLREQLQGDRKGLQAVL